MRVMSVCNNISNYQAQNQKRQITNFEARQINGLFEVKGLDMTVEEIRELRKLGLTKVTGKQYDEALALCQSASTENRSVFNFFKSLVTAE